MEKLTTKKFLIEYKEHTRYSMFSEEFQYFMGNILLNARVYYQNGKNVLNLTFDEVTITRDGYVICKIIESGLIVIFSEEDEIIKLEGVKDIKSRKNYFLVEERNGMIRVIDKKYGNDIFYFQGSFCWGRKETVILCNTNWFLTKGEEVGYYLYDCINKRILDIKVDKIRSLNTNKFGVCDEKNNLIKVFTGDKIGVYDIQIEKGKKEVIKKLIPIEYQKIEPCNGYILAQKSTEEIDYYNYDGVIL